MSDPYDDWLRARRRPERREPLTSGQILGRTTAGLVAGVLTLAVLIACVFGAAAGCKAYSRAQRRADANNKVQITHILIRNAQQQARIVKAEIAATRASAQKRVVEAHGIRRAQDIISSTLTDRYLQHEAIAAQRAMVHSPNHSQIYVPSGQNGIPIVKTVK